MVAIGPTNQANNVHVDQHAVYIHPLDNDFVVLGNDGGLIPLITVAIAGYGMKRYPSHNFTPVKWITRSWRLVWWNTGQRHKPHQLTGAPG